MSNRTHVNDTYKRQGFCAGINRRSMRIAAAAFCSLMLAAGLSSCHSSKKATHNAYTTPEVENVHIGKADKNQVKIIEEAYTWLGTPYKYAADEKGKGTDCSGMVMRVYESVTGEKLPRNSAKQAEFCEERKSEEVDAGDLIFFATGKDPERISHVGIVIDNETFIHASSSKGVVVSNFTTPYYKRTFRKFGRVPRNKDLISELK